MAIPTTYEIDYSCGHSESRDLSDKPAGSRAGYAQFLAKGKCRDCFIKSSNRKNSAQRKKFLEELNQEKMADSKKLGLPELHGTDKQVPWATAVRVELIQAAHDNLVMGSDAVMSEEEFDSKILEPAKLIRRAGWWIDNKDTDAEDLEELVNDVEERDTCENPFE